LDVVVVEATAILENGGIVPGASVGASPELIQMADKVRSDLDVKLSRWPSEISLGSCQSHGYFKVPS
jgi:acyl-CoA hydrolase